MAVWWLYVNIHVLFKMFFLVFTEDLARIMTAALKEDKVDFVRLAIQNGVIPKKFLTRDKLKDLYFEVSFINYFLYILKSS